VSAREAEGQQARNHRNRLRFEAAEESRSGSRSGLLPARLGKPDPLRRALSRHRGAFTGRGCAPSLPAFRLALFDPGPAGGRSELASPTLNLKLAPARPNLTPRGAPATPPLLGLRYRDSPAPHVFSCWPISDLGVPPARGPCSTHPRCLAVHTLWKNSAGESNCGTSDRLRRSEGERWRRRSGYFRVPSAAPDAGG
jgi:hypothetical protein